MSSAVVPGPWPIRAELAAPFDAPVPPNPPEDPPEGGGGGDGRDDDGTEGREPDFGRVVPLGTAIRREGQAFVLLAASGAKVVVGPRDIYGVPQLEALFGGIAARRWLAREFPLMVMARGPDGKPKRDDKGRPEMVPSGDFSARDVGGALATACTRLGPADAMQHRRDGLWTGEAGGLVVHTGRRVWTHPDGVGRKLGWRLGAAIHIAADPLEQPAAEAATAAQCQALMQSFELWHYAPASQGMAKAVLMGGIACGLYAGALEWRPHLWLRGPTNAGKSTLLRLLRAATGTDAPSDDVSEAYVRTKFDGRSRLILLDEREANLRGVQEVLQLMRGASNGQGAKVGRIHDGAARTFSVACGFILAAISTPAFEPQDASRITTIALRRPQAVTQATEARLSAAIAAAAALHPALFTRLIQGWERYEANRVVYRGALLQASATARCADQLAALLAGYRTLVDDQVIDAMAAAHDLSEMAIEVITPDQAAESDAPAQVIAHLLASRVAIGDGRQSLTVAALLEEARNAQHLYRQARKTEGEYAAEVAAKKWKKRAGMLQLKWTAEGLCIGNGSPALNRVFDGTIWENKVWRQSLRDLPGATDSGIQRFSGGGQVRGVLIPVECLPLRPPDGAGPPTPDDDW